MRVDPFAHKCLLSDTGMVLKNCRNRHSIGIFFQMMLISINCCIVELQTTEINKLITVSILFLLSGHLAFAK